MKRTLILLAILFATIAASSKQYSPTKTNFVNCLSYPSGSGTITDACGNEYPITWYCNYNCNGMDVISAIMEWGDENTECGFDSYHAD